MTPIVAAAIGLLAGGGAGYFLFLRVLTGKADSIVRDAEMRGESIKEKKILQAKEKFIELKEKQANQRKDLDRKLNEREERIKRTEKTSSGRSTKTSKRKSATHATKKNLNNGFKPSTKSKRTWKSITPRPSKHSSN